MLTITATNFGIYPNDIQIKEYHDSNMIVLDGEFDVDTTVQEYDGIRPMTLTVEGLPFDKSRSGTALVTVLSKGVKYATITKVQVKDKNTISISKILPYKSAGAYAVRLSTVLIPEYASGDIRLNPRNTYTPINKGNADDIEIHTVEHTGWMMMAFKASSLSFDDNTRTVEMSIPGFPVDISCSLPILYNEGLWVDLGSKYYPASIHNGILTISKDDNADEASGTGNKFSRIIVVR